MSVNDTKGQLGKGTNLIEDFNSKLPALWKKIGTHDVMTLSTCSDSRVTSRKMSVVVVNGMFYCQTNENYLKYRQILQNFNVALCTKNFSIEGKCRDIGTPLADENSLIAKALKKHFLLAYKTYSHLDVERLMEITPTLIYSWSYEGIKPYMEFWDFQNYTYRKEHK